MDLTPAHDACRDFLGDRYGDLHYALLFAPPPVAARVLCMHAVAHLVTQVPARATDAGLARVKLQWWREQLQAATAGRAQHPLLRACQATGVPWTDLPAVIDAIELDLERLRPGQHAGLHEYLARRHGPLAHACARALGCVDGTTPAAMVTLAVAAAHARAIVELGADLRAGRPVIARDDLKHFGLKRRDLESGNPPRGFADLAAFVHRRAVGYHREALAGIPPIDRTAQLPQRILAALDFARLAEAARGGYRVLDRGVELTAIRKLWIAWRTRLNF